MAPWQVLPTLSTAVAAGAHSAWSLYHAETAFLICLPRAVGKLGLWGMP